MHTVDVQTQGEGPRWTLHQWTLYWDARRSGARDPAAPAPGAAAAAAATGAASAQAAATPRRAAPAEDEADSAAVRRKRSAEEEAAAQQLKGISAESKKRLLEVAALPLAGTALEVRAWGGWAVGPPPGLEGWADVARPVCLQVADIQQAAGSAFRPHSRGLPLCPCPLPCTPCMPCTRVGSLPPCPPLRRVQGEVSPPSAVRAVDLAQQVWPEGAPTRPTAGVTLVMSPEGAYTDFHMAPGGASGGCPLGRQSAGASAGLPPASLSILPPFAIRRRVRAQPCLPHPASQPSRTACRAPPPRSLAALRLRPALPGAGAAHPAQPGDLRRLGGLGAPRGRLPAGALRGRGTRGAGPRCAAGRRDARLVALYVRRHALWSGPATHACLRAAAFYLDSRILRPCGMPTSACNCRAARLPFQLQATP